MRIAAEKVKLEQAKIAEEEAKKIARAKAEAKAQAFMKFAFARSL